MKRRWWFVAAALLTFATALVLSLLIRWPTQYQVLTPECPRVSALAFSPDGNTLALGGHPNVKLWNVASRRETAALAGHTGNVTCLAYNAQGTILASGSDDHTIRLWEIPGGKELAILEGHVASVGHVAFSPDGKTLASGSSGKPMLKLWDVATGKPKIDLTLWFEGEEKQKKSLEDHARGQVTCLAFSPDGRILASGLGGASPLIFWDTATGEGTLDTKDLKTSAVSLAFSSDGRFLAVGNFGGVRVQVWELATGKELPSCEGSDHMVFCPDGRTLATSGSAHLKLWDVATGKELGTFEQAQRSLWHVETQKVHSLAISPDGKTLVTGAEGGTIMLWDVAAIVKMNR